MLLSVRFVAVFTALGGEKLARTFSKLAQLFDCADVGLQIVILNILNEPLNEVRLVAL